MHIDCSRSDKNKQKKCRGSLTVEAVLTFPVFLCFFILLIYFIKLACINISLNHAAAETAKHIASSCYPVTYVNRFEDEIFPREGYIGSIIKNEVKKADSYILYGSKNEYSDFLSKILSGEAGEKDFSCLMNEFAENILKKGLQNMVLDETADDYFTVKVQAEYKAAEVLMKKFISDKIMDSDNLKVVFVNLPQSNTEYRIKNNSVWYKNICDKIGYKPGQNEVVIAIEYKTDISLPFISTREIKITKKAVEKAWVNGSYTAYNPLKLFNKSTGSNSKTKSDNGSSKDESEKSEESDSEVVYITRTGTRYHKNGCMYLRKSKIAITKREAIKKGYVPCKICIGGQKPFGK